MTRPTEAAKPRTVYVAFTIDVDRDCAAPIKGFKQAGSKTWKGTDLQPTFGNSINGFKDWAGILEGKGIPATFFIEGELADKLRKQSGGESLKGMVKQHEVGSHGFAHEDFTGESTGVKMTQEEIEDSLKKSVEAIENAFGVTPAGVRTPYLHYSTEIHDAVSRHFQYDSSFYGTRIKREKGVPRIPVLEGLDESGNKMQGYFWKLMEGDRNPEQYVSLVRRAVDGGAKLVVLATHSWHHYLSEDGTKKSPETAYAEMQKITDILEELRNLKGVKIEFVTLSKALEKLKPSA